MSWQIILKTALAIIVAFSFTNVASAQLKPSHNSKHVWVDLSVLDTQNTGWSFKQEVIFARKRGNLLMPPSKMPGSSYINRYSTGKNLNKSPRIKSKLRAELTKKRYEAKKLSTKIKLIKPKNKNLKRPTSKTKLPKRRGPKKLVPTQKQALKKPIKVSKSMPTKSNVNKKALAPAPRAVPLPPVKVLKIPPPTPKINETTEKRKVNSQQIASRSYKTNQQSKNKRLIFKQGNSNLSNAAKETLNDVSMELKAKPNSRMLLKAYAGEPKLSSSKARRLSLSRALSVRSYLIKQGIRSTRIDVRALGNKTSVGEPNRVDLNVITN